MDDFSYVDDLRGIIEARHAEITRLRAELAERTTERDEAIVQMRGAGTRADNAERREAHLRAALARAEAEVSRLREAMPSDDVKDTIVWASGWCRVEMGVRRHDDLRDWLARLDAARKEVG